MLTTLLLVLCYKVLIIIIPLRPCGSMGRQPVLSTAHGSFLMLWPPPMSSPLVPVHGMLPVVLGLSYFPPSLWVVVQGLSCHVARQ